jgi:ParB family transcriptional regulator, chromosome partitioning protein
VAQQRRGLGKGLGALIPDAQRTSPVPVTPADGQPANAATPNDDNDLRQVDGAYFEEVAIESISPNPRQPRLTFDEDELDELAASITEVGLLQPVVVRKLGPGRYELVMGERRMRASQRAGLEYIPAIVRETSDNNMLRDALIENIHRAQLDPLEEAAAYKQLLDDFGATHAQLSERIGRSRPHISNTLRLLDLPPAVQRRIAAGVISAGHARALLGLDSPEAQQRLADRIVREGLSVRTVEEIVKIGDDQVERAARRPATAKPVAPALNRLSDRLSDLFDTKVKVVMGAKKGKITLEFGDIDDLERIVKAMSPEPDAPEA